MSEQHLDDLAIALADLVASAGPPARDDSNPPRPCPVCGQTMQLIRQHDVVMDVCEDHGVWLDQGELALILERAYWYRRENDRPYEKDPTAVMDQTRKRFVAGLSRAAGFLAG